MKRVIGGLLLVVLLSAAQAWVPEQTDVWRDGNIPVSFDFSGAPPGPYDWSAASRDGITAWNALLQRVKLQEVPLAGHAWYDNGHNELFFGTQMYDQPFPSGVLAITAITSDRGTRVETDIVFNKNQPWEIYHGKVGFAPDFRRVALHELGHVLGLDHPDEAGQTVTAIMNSTESDTDSPTADDTSGIRALYDRGSTAPPVILGSPKVNTPSPYEGSWVRFSIAAGGRGPLAYQWRRDGNVVPGATDAALYLAAAKRTDGGNYTVVVSNAAGSAASTSLALEVRPAIPPTLTPEYVNSSVNITCGSDWIMEARGVTAGTAPMQYIWKHNGAIFDTTANSNITVHDLQFSDSGDYTVTLKNAAGTVDGVTFHLTVTPGEPPQFVQDPTPAQLVIGNSTTLNANATGSGSLQYQWYKDGTAIPDATNPGLSIPTVAAADAGTYTVTATNAFGTITSAPQVITVVATPDIVPPAILEQPKSVTDFVGAPTSFAIVAEGDNLVYRWYKDGNLISTSTGSLWFQTNLSFNRLKESDSGIYTVEISNSVGSATSRGAKLTVLPARKPVFTTQLVGYTGAPGQSYRLSVTVLHLIAMWGGVSNEQDFTYEWFKDGVSLGSPSRWNSLDMTGAESESGQYFVRVTSYAGMSADSDTVTVNVKAGNAPLINQPPPSRLIDSGDSETIRFVALDLEVQRRRQAASGGTLTYTQQTVDGPTIAGVSPGKYVMTVSSGTVTETSPPYTLGFLPARIPIVANGPGGRAASPGDMFDLWVNATGDAPITYQWSKDGVDLPGATDARYSFLNFAPAQVGTYRVAVTSAAGTTLSEPAVVEVRVVGRPIIKNQPYSVVSGVDRTQLFQVEAVGGTLTYQWYKDGDALSNATNSNLLVPVQGAEAAGSYSVVVSNASGSVTSRAATLRVVLPQRPPEILLSPKATTAPVNGDVTLSVGATGGPLPDHYQWRKDGVDIPGASDAELRIHGVQARDAGSYSAVAYNANGTATSTAAALTVDTSGRLANLSTRSQVGTGDDVLIAGFVVTETKPRKLLIRGVGDQLSEFGVDGVLRNPYLELFGPNATRLDSSDNWAAGDDYDGARVDRMAQLRAAEQEVGAFPLRTDTADGALIATLKPGLYSAKVSGVVNTTGVGLIEIYELGTPALDRLINLSCRSHVGTGGDALFVGVSIHGQTKRRLLIRAIGPGLSAFNIGGLLPDPQLTLYRGDTPIVSNDNWGDATDVATMRAAENKVGAFPLAAGGKDAAILLDLDPGLYSVKVTGVNDTTGLALVEAYEVPN